MVKKTQLIESLRALESALRESRKIETADFFNQSIVTITNETDNKLLREHLQKLCSSGAMVQYANFSYREEQLFDKCYEEAKQILSMI